MTTFLISMLKSSFIAHIEDEHYGDLLASKWRFSSVSAGFISEEEATAVIVSLLQQPSGVGCTDFIKLKHF